MSTYGWEKGTIAIPSASWAPFKQALRTGVNKAMEEDYNLALKLYENLGRLKKKTRGLDLNEALNDELGAIETSYSYGWKTSTRKYNFKVKDYDDIQNILLSRGQKPALLKPQKKQFTLANSSTLVFYNSHCSVELDNKNRTVRWVVPENNHAVDQAHETALARVFFGELGKIKWTRNSGGVIVGNDEYNRESESEDGGGNYTSYRFGPLGEPSSFHSPLRRRKTATKKSVSIQK